MNKLIEIFMSRRKCYVFTAQNITHGGTATQTIWAVEYFGNEKLDRGGRVVHAPSPPPPPHP